MFYDNKANRLRKEVLVRVARAFFAEDTHAALDRIPLKMRPKQKHATRCCIYKDRAILKYRCMAALGFSIENEEDELKPISAYFDDALARQQAAAPQLTVIDEACSACVRTRYSATNACRGCIARSCESVCPKQAIAFRDGQAQLNPETCVNCGLCMKACAYHAIIRIPIPCEEACPVGAITKDETTGREVIDHDACIYCGKCVRECPFAAISEKLQLVDVLQHLKDDRVIAMVAPSVTGQLPGTLPQLVTALRELGFSDVVEVAEGADETARHESAEWAETIAGGQRFMTTSCCPAYMETVKKHLPEMSPYVSDTPTPMAYTAASVRRDTPTAITVFVGPCIAKRVEAVDNPDVDYVLTFEELGAMLIGAKIDVLECDEATFETHAHREGRGFAASGGVTAAVQALVASKEPVRPVQVDGIDRKTINQMRIWANRQCPGNFVEVMACEGGCLAGPGTVASPRVAKKQLENLLATSPTLAGGS
jgi:[FeFe] hydrogenase (group B1/B3)